MRLRLIWLNSTVGMLAGFVVAAVALFSLLYGLTSGYLMRQVDDRLAGEVGEYAGIDVTTAVHTIDALSKRNIAISRPYAIFDAQGSRLAGNVAVLPRVPTREPYYYDQAVTLGAQRVTAHYRGILIPMPGGQMIVVGHQIDGILDFDHRLILTLLFGLTATILLASLCIAGLAAASRRRIREIHASCIEIMEGDLHKRLPTRGTHHALDRLSGVVNTMLGEIERLVLEVQNVCSGIAHDLRTPMTQLRAGLERANRRAASVDDYRHAMDDAITQSDVVLHRFAALLRIAEIESGSRRARFQWVRLDDVIRDVLELYEPMAESRFIELRFSAPDPVRLEGDVDLLFGAIENLLDNALKFTPTGGKVEVRIALENGLPVVRIADTGPGIPAGERAAVLRPFYRSPGSAGQASGHGLGLSLAAAIARIHWAELDFQDNHPGCLVTLRFMGRAKPILTD